MTGSPGPRRIVSLVPSETESVVDLVGIERLVGRTRYCVEPAGVIERVLEVGGTKKIDVATVIALAPDLVLANQEENGRADVEALREAGLRVHVSFPKSVPEAIGYLRTLAQLLYLDGEAESLRRAEEARSRALAATGAPPVAVFVPIWKDPWMTFDGRTFASDLLELCGARNVFSDRPRRYPLAADLGEAPPAPPAPVGDRDTRYPRVTLDEVARRAPDLVLLPDEPYAFEDAHRACFEPLGVPVRLVDGKDLFWYGTRLGPAIDRVRGLLAAARGR